MRGWTGDGGVGGKEETLFKPPKQPPPDHREHRRRRRFAKREYEFRDVFGYVPMVPTNPLKKDLRVDT